MARGTSLGYSRDLKGSQEDPAASVVRAGRAFAAASNGLCKKSHVLQAALLCYMQKQPSFGYKQMPLATCNPLAYSRGLKGSQRI